MRKEKESETAEEVASLSYQRKAFGRISSLALARSATQEIGNPMAVHYIIHGITFISSSFNHFIYTSSWI